MLLVGGGEEKKDCGSFPLDTFTSTPNPLAAAMEAPSSGTFSHGKVLTTPSALTVIPMPGVKAEKMPDASSALTALSAPGKMGLPPESQRQRQQQQRRHHPTPPPASLATTAPTGVPNPIMASSHALSAPSPCLSPVGGVAQMLDDPTTPATAAGNNIPLAPSPLSSPILTNDPPSRPGSSLSVGTSASTMDAMASAMDDRAGVIGEASSHGCVAREDSGIGGYDLGPPPTRRKRANSIHWAGTATATTTTAASPLSPCGSLRGEESLQPVNFGDYVHVVQQQPQEQQSQAPMHFSPGSGGGGGGLVSQRKYSSASMTSLRTAESSNSLYSESRSEYSEGSGSTSIQHAGGGTRSPLDPIGAQAGIPSVQHAGGILRRSATAPSPVDHTVTATNKTTDKRQKRLERNRESARASRRRRKHYLEELEARVTKLSEEMDHGRVEHAGAAVRTVRGMRAGRLREAEDIMSGSSLESSSSGGTRVETSGGRAQAPSCAGPMRPQQPVVRSGIQHNVKAMPIPFHPLVHHRANKPAQPLSASIERATKALTTNLSRTSDELRIAGTFMKQQLMGLVQPADAKFMLWLSLQKDGFYRGGRSASERLSAARIGERLLHGGTYRAAPNNGMWPLTCHEICLSYDQEDRIRQTQRSVLANSESWIHRHTALATQNVVENIHDNIWTAQTYAKKREQSLMSILTPEQKVKFLSWASKKKHIIRKLADARIKGAETSSATASETSAALAPSAGVNTKTMMLAQCGDREYKTSPNRHVAANLYIIDHLLSKVKQRAQQANNTPAPSFTTMHPNMLKKLSRRPAFESLAGRQGNDSDGKLSREMSFPSTGSLKRSVSDALGSSDGNMDQNLMTNSYRDNGVTPESAQLAGQAAVMAVLKDVLPIIPKSAWRNPSYPPAMAPTMAAGAAAGAAHHRLATLAPQPPQAFRTMPPISHKQRAQPRGNTIPINQTLQNQPMAAAAAGNANRGASAHPPHDDLVTDIPMPTPVSVLLRTSDDFISAPLYEQQEPLEVVSSTPVVGSVFSAPDFTIPEHVASFATTVDHVSSSSTTGLLAYSHQSAPDFTTYQSLQSEPMTVIPESLSFGASNPPTSARGAAGTGDFVGDFGLEDIPMMEVDDWAIGEGFDMDMEEGAE